LWQHFRGAGHAGGTANETIIDFDKGVSKTDFLAALTMGESHQTWNSTGINNTVADGDTFVVTAQDGTTTVTYTIAVPTKAIGESYLNGKVGYVLKSADPGYILGETHGLIAATADYGAPTIVAWISGTNNITSALNGNTLTAIGTGLANTDAMRNQPDYSTSVQVNAASVCYDYNTGSDLHSWYLPSLDELHKLYLNKGAIGGFVNNLYWSSSERNQWAGFYENLTDGTSDGLMKGIGSYVRCVKTF